jgi:hypothetical protein
MRAHFRATFLLTIFLIGGGPSLAFAEESPSKATVTAYYFHGTYRCPTCNKMEQYSKEVIENDFKNDLDSGALQFRSVNIESRGNEHYAGNYQLYTKALILSLTEDGKEVRFKSLDKIWEYARNKERFQNYVRDEVTAFMKGS